MHQILHVVVVGFHHKRGCQVEFCYPPLKPSTEKEETGSVDDSHVPEAWANLPSLALPDGAHNVSQDTIYFMLPSLEDPTKAVFGISCYRQIATKDLLSKDDDMTRSTVQKSVCVLSKVPLFGVLKAKLQLITQAYFNERDFAKVEVLSQMYTNLCDMFEGDLVDGQAASMDIPVTNLVKRFKYRLITLFKLILLEKKVVFNIFPVELLGDTIIGLISLFPQLLEEGIFYGVAPAEVATGSSENEKKIFQPVTEERPEKVSENADGKVDDCEEALKVEVERQDEVEKAKTWEEELRSPLRGRHPKKSADYGFPLSIFTQGSLFLPYLSISYLDMVRGPGVRSYVIGATNALFVQRKNLLDAVVTIDEAGEGILEVTNPELKKQLQSTNADLRFMDYVIKTVETGDPAVWEGGDEWVRTQFNDYLLWLFTTVRSDLVASLTDFGSLFVEEWKNTRNFRTWLAAAETGRHDKLLGLVPGHAFAGSMGASDVILRVGSTLQDSEKLRKMKDILSTTSLGVSELRKSVFGFLSKNSAPPTPSNPPSTTLSASSSAANLQATTSEAAQQPQNNTAD